MLCALTVRRLKPDSFDEFREKFVPSGDSPPAGWKRFHIVRGVSDPNEVVTFGFFDGTPEEMQQSQDDADYDERRNAIEPLVESVVSNGVYEIVQVMDVDG
jgi:hypothetical protein